MILIEVNNKNTHSNFELLAKTEEWAKQNITTKWVIVLNPHVEGCMKITNCSDQDLPRHFEINEW